MWETDNSAMLQLAGGGGGAELLAFRDLSRHVRALAPPPSRAREKVIVSPSRRRYSPFFPIGAPLTKVPLEELAVGWRLFGWCSLGCCSECTD